MSAADQQHESEDADLHTSAGCRARRVHSRAAISLPDPDGRGGALRLAAHQRHRQRLALPRRGWRAVVRSAPPLHAPRGWAAPLRELPTIQIGPLSLLLAAPIRLIGTDKGRTAGAILMTAVAPALLCVVERTVRLFRPSVDERFLQLTVLLGGLMFVQSWATLAVIYAHLDDVLVLAAGVGALWAAATRRPVLVGVCIGIADRGEAVGRAAGSARVRVPRPHEDLCSRDGARSRRLGLGALCAGRFEDARRDQAPDHSFARIGAAPLRCRGDRRAVMDSPRTTRVHVGGGNDRRRREVLGGQCSS